MVFRRATIFAALLAAVLTAIMASHSLADGPRDQEARQIGESLACPICEGQSVAESNSLLAQQMRDVIRKKVEAGEPREMILEYFVDRYGEGVLLSPPKRGFNQILWWLPTLSLVLGAGLAALVLRRWIATRRTASPTEIGPNGMTGEELERYAKRLKQELGAES